MLQDLNHNYICVEGHHIECACSFPQDLLRQKDREARAASGLREKVEACEGKLREAASGQTHQTQELSQKLQQAEQALRTAHARLKDRGRSSLLLEESAAAAEARAKSLETELASEAAARAASIAAAEASAQELEKAKAAWEHERAEMSAKAKGVADAGKKMVEELDAALAECKGRVAGLGEGCGRCWQMLDEAQASRAFCLLVHANLCRSLRAQSITVCKICCASKFADVVLLVQGDAHTAKMHAAGVATGVCGLVLAAAYVYSLIQRRQVLRATILFLIHTCPDSSKPTRAAFTVVVIQEH